MTNGRKHSILYQRYDDILDAYSDSWSSFVSGTKRVNKMCYTDCTEVGTT